MPRVKDVVKDYERLSMPQATHLSACHARSATPHISRAPPRRIIHPLLRAAFSNSSMVSGSEHGPIKDSQDTFAPHDSYEPSSAAPLFTTPTRNDEPLLLSPLNYSHALSMKDSASSLSTKVDPQIPRQLIQDQNGPKAEALSDHPIDNEIIVDGVPAESITCRPIPSEDVFQRDAPILSLPALDKFLAKLPAPVFSPIQDITTPSSRKGSSDSPRMFIPLQELSKGRSLQDMFYNRKVALPYRNRNSILSSIVTLTLGVAGSSVASSLYSLAGIFDAVQVFALILSTIIPGAGKHLGQTWRKLFLGTIPNILAFNFFPLLTQKLAFFSIFAALALALMYYFHRATRPIIYDERNTEGLYRTAKTGSGWGLVFVSFTLCLIYLPISTIAVHGLVWSADFWPVQNLNSTGQAHDFNISVCYTTSARPDEANLAPLVIPLCIVTFICITIYFPLRLRCAIQQCLPTVDLYTELGRRRSSTEMEHEYQRRLNRDRNPFSYLYNDYRRQWGTYKSMYLIVKFSTLLIIALCDPTNCIVGTIPARTVLIFRQTTLILVMICFLALQTTIGPFIDPVSNASEWTSRAGYVMTSTLGIGDVLSKETKAILQGPVLYVAYIFIYGLNLYFTVVHWSWVQRVIKRLEKRIDFSIDIFSPLLDVSARSPHIKRRIWQETLSTLFLTSPGTATPPSQKMMFIEGPEAHQPPYLSNFQGTAGERHVENLKILREMGRHAYRAAVEGNRNARTLSAFEKICAELAGPDAYWSGMDNSRPATFRWGNLWCIPFPPSIVIRFDDGKEVALNGAEQFEELISQNFSKYVLYARNVRQSLRALENQYVYWPYTHSKIIGPRHSFLCCGTAYSALSSSYFELAQLRIKRGGKLVFTGAFDFASGFDVTLEYSPRLSVTSNEIGLTVETFLTPRLASFLALNERTIRARLPLFFSELRRYRRALTTEFVAKGSTLSYEFLDYGYEHPASPSTLLKVIQETELDITGKVTQMFQSACKDGSLTSVDERFRNVTRSLATAWWYLFWDDFWRRNHATVRTLRIHAPDFDPWYPSSIAYRPLPRPALDAFLTQRGLLKPSPRAIFAFRGVFHSGLINRVYFRMNELTFENQSSKMVHTVSETYRAGREVALQQRQETPSHQKTSSMGTGGGTDHDDVSIRNRPFYKYEEAFVSHRGKWSGKFAVWFGLTPFSPILEEHSHDIMFDLRLDSEHNQYIRV